MMVYGDPHREESLISLKARLQARLQILQAQEKPSLDDLRLLVIQAGQMEQAAQDTLAASLSAEEARLQGQKWQAVTDSAARAFVGCWQAAQEGSAPNNKRIQETLVSCSSSVNALPETLEVSASVKLPEGFAFYALFPEQYGSAALHWLDAHPEAQAARLVVVGVRSIGTSLSAVVQATLERAGCTVHRLTVRPTGHPFARQTEIPASELGGADWALIVDEGPGQSGSSMASVAQALTRVGMSPERFAFFPGHGGEPGKSGDETTRKWWADTPRYVVPLHDLRWNRRSLLEILSDRTALLSPHADDSPKYVEDGGGGLWRRFVYSDVSQWPAVCAAFERPKYRCTTRQGFSVLWKFAGLADSGPTRSQTEQSAHRTPARPESDWTLPVLDTCCGFLATPWAEGVPLTFADASPSLLEHIGRYIVAVAGTPLSHAEQEAGLERLRNLLYWNVWEGLGEEAAAQTQKWSEYSSHWKPQSPLPAYGDGHLAPHEWLRMPAGELLKTDSLTHDADHTVIGRQALVWDIAGAMVEWDLSEEQVNIVLKSVQEGGSADSSR